MSVTGHMLHGVKHVGVVGSRGEVIEMESDGRAYMWSNGNVTVYSANPELPWVIVPAHRVVGIVGGEHG